MNAKLLEIPSPTFRKVLQTRIALGSIEDADEETKAQIRAEIEAANTIAPSPEDEANTDTPDITTPDAPAATTGGASMAQQSSFSGTSKPALSPAKKSAERSA